MTSKIDERSLQPRNRSFSLEACLQETGISVASATPLTGGLVNYVWRVIDVHGKSWILKHAEPSLKLNPSIQSDPARLSHEARGTDSEAVRVACEAVDGIAVPGVIAYNGSLHTLVTTDGGDKSLAEAYEAGELDMVDVGRRLAR
jgi:hypothetical protein